MKIIEYSIKNRIVVLFATLVLTLAGIISYFRLGKLEDPEFKVKEAIAVTLYPLLKHLWKYQLFHLK